MNALQDFQALGAEILRKEGMAEYVAWLQENMERIKEFQWQEDRSAEVEERLLTVESGRQATGQSGQGLPGGEPCCEHCGANEWWDEMVESELVCGQCGMCRPYLCADRRALTFEDEVRVSTWAFNKGLTCNRGYQKMSHFNEILDQLGARQTKCCPPEVVEAVKQRALSLGEDPEALTGLDVRRHMKALKLGKHYEEAYLVAGHLCKFKRMVVIPAEVESQMRVMFKQIQRPYSLYKGKRKSFLNFRYVIFQFLRQLGFPEVGAQLPLLKSKARLKEHDTIYQRICSDLHWRFQPVLTPVTGQRSSAPRPARKKRSLPDQRPPPSPPPPLDNVLPPVSPYSRGTIF